MQSSSGEGLPDLWKETYDLVAQVPEGCVTTYGEVARALGDIVASRFVGLAMSKNDDIVRVPCRRVVQTDGYVGGYTGGGPAKKIRLLRSEGVRISGTTVMDLPKILFTDFRSTYPLKELRKRQLALRKHLKLESGRSTVKRVAGIDVAYDGDLSYAAMVTFDLQSGREVDRAVTASKAIFPYVPTYLAFREIPVIKDLMKLVDDKTVVMYDGNGILHPERFGVASQVGVVFGVPTIGVAKKQLCGTLPDSSRSVREIRLDGALLGHALSRRAGSKPVFVSAGHLVSPDRALAITRRFLRHRIPEPTRMAHIVAGEARRGTNHK